MKQNNYSHPLDRLLPDSSTLFLEAMVPFVDLNTKKLLVLFIKIRELSEIMNRLNDPDALSASGLHCHAENPDDLAEKICDFLPPELSAQIRQTLKMLHVMQAMEHMPNISGFAPEPQPSHEPFDSAPCDQQEGSDSHVSASNLYDSVMSILNETASTENERRTSQHE